MYSEKSEISIDLVFFVLDHLFNNLEPLCQLYVNALLIKSKRIQYMYAFLWLQSLGPGCSKHC